LEPLSLSYGCWRKSRVRVRRIGLRYVIRILRLSHAQLVVRLHASRLGVPARLLPHELALLHPLITEPSAQHLLTLPGNHLEPTLLLSPTGLPGEAASAALHSHLSQLSPPLVLVADHASDNRPDADQNKTAGGYDHHAKESTVVLSSAFLVGAAAMRAVTGRWEPAFEVYAGYRCLGVLPESAAFVAASSYLY
jgi:hypothetical protein